MNPTRITPPFLLIASLGLPPAAHACATCGCALSTDAAMGYSAAPGWRINLQYDFIDQDQLRAGTRAVAPAQAASINDAGGAQEVEQRTINRYATLGVSWHPDADWNLNLLVPYIDRSHTTYGNAGVADLVPTQVSGADVRGLGDVKLIASWQGFLSTRNLGVQLGVKLPTGRYGGQDVDTGVTVGHDPVFFSTGPNAVAGQALDASLQPGTGSTDVIVGGYAYQALGEDVDGFVNGQFQSAVRERLNQVGGDFRPGNLATLSFGARYAAHPDWVPQLQVNVTRKTADQGALADTANTAGTVVYLSPGITASVHDRLQLYGFVQVPVYSRLAGYQLFPHWTASAGISLAF